MPNFGGEAYKANPKAKTGGASPYNSTSVQPPPVNTGGSFSPMPNETYDFTAASTKGGKITGNKKPSTAGGKASPY